MNQDWLDGAEPPCADPALPVNLFCPSDYLVHKNSTAANNLIRQARGVCATCPFTAECVADGFDDGWHIRGGLLPSERTVRRRCDWCSKALGNEVGRYHGPCAVASRRETQIRDNERRRLTA